MTLFDPIADADEFPAARRARPAAELPRAPSTGRAPYVVVATQGVWDEEALASARCARRGLRRARRLADPGRGRPGVAARRGGHPAGAARRAARPGGHRPRGGDRRPRSRSRSSRSSSRSDAAAPRSWPRPGPRRWPAMSGSPRRSHPLADDIVLLDPVCGMTVDAARRPPPRRARGQDLRVLLDRLPHALHQGPRDVPLAGPRPLDAGCRSAATTPPEAHAVQWHRRDRRAARQGLGVPHGSRAGRQLRAGRPVDRRRSTTDHFKARAKVGVGFITARSTST